MEHRIHMLSAVVVLGLLAACAPPADDETPSLSSSEALAIRTCALGTGDVVPKEIRWTSTEPEGTDPPVTLGTIVRPDCTMHLKYVRYFNGVTIPIFKVYLHKEDTAGGACDAPKGYEVLNGSVGMTPVAILTPHATDSKLFAVSGKYKNTPSGSAPMIIWMAQYDWETGDRLNRAAMAVEGYQQDTPPQGTPMSLVVNGCDVVLQAYMTSFPGATGTPTGNGVEAHFTHFIAPEKRDPSGWQWASSAFYLP